MNGFLERKDIFYMMSKLQDRATKFDFKLNFKGYLQQLKQKKTLCSLEVLLLSSVILIIWMIFTAPTIVFALSSATATISEVISMSAVGCPQRPFFFI
jgi:hypothetical protein